MKNILITGGGGFIGTHLRRKLEEQGHKVQIIDINHPDQSAGQDVTIEKTWATLPGWHIEDFVKALPDDENDPDVIVHMAAEPNLRAVKANPEKAYKTMTMGVMNVVKRFNESTINPQFVFISSSMVYGDFKDGMKEDGNTKPKNIYGEAKLAGERFTKLFQKRDNLDYIVIRPSGVYGPGDMPDRVVSKFFEKAMKNDPITLHNGDNKVDFTYVEDTVQGIIKAATSSVANVSFNITQGNATSLRKLAETIIEITGSESELEDIGNHDLYPMRGTLDISRAKDLIGYEPRYELKEGLKKYYDWIRQYSS